MKQLFSKLFTRPLKPGEWVHDDGKIARIVEDTDLKLIARVKEHDGCYTFYNFDKRTGKKRINRIYETY